MNAAPLSSISMVYAGGLRFRGKGRERAALAFLVHRGMNSRVISD